MDAWWPWMTFQSSAVTGFILLTWIRCKNLSHLLCTNSSKHWQIRTKLWSKTYMVVQLNKPMLDGLAIHFLIANFLYCTIVKNYENWLTTNKVIAIIKWVTFLIGTQHRYATDVIRRDKPKTTLKEAADKELNSLHLNNTDSMVCNKRRLIKNNLTNRSDSEWFLQIIS